MSLSTSTKGYYNGSGEEILVSNRLTRWWKGEEKNTLFFVNPDTMDKLNLQVSLDSEAKNLLKSIDASLKSMKKEQSKTAAVGIALAYFAGLVAALALIVVAPSGIRGGVVAIVCVVAVIVAIALFLGLVVFKD